MEHRHVGLRKGLWTEEEDTLLRKCVEKYGEGKWHEIPLKAGLKRCRKSCRMRWLNYLKPNINRGQFTVDEIDLILRLHKLLGNRWALIAGRLPGRTANDVKNYWNTHIRKKISTEHKNDIKKLNSINPNNNKSKEIKNTIIFKPRPRTLSKSIIHRLNSNISGDPNNSTVVAPPAAPLSNDENGWWQGLLFNDDKQSDGAGNTSGGLEEEIVKMSTSRENFQIGNLESSYYGDLFADIDIWHFLDKDAYNNVNIKSLI